MDIGVSATSTHLDFISGYRGSADMQWNTMPTQLRREFDNAGSMGELVENAALRGQVARFLHKHNRMTRMAATGFE
jgi:hypothetical protein